MRKKALVKKAIIVGAGLFLLMTISIRVWASAAWPTTIEGIAAYNGADSQQMLEAGAKKEGTLTYYTVNANEKSRSAMMEGFQKKYPFIKLKMYRADSTALVNRLIQEYQANTSIAGAIEQSPTQLDNLVKGKLLAPYYSPSVTKIKPEMICQAPDGKTLIATVMISPFTFGYNTKMIPPDQVPKTWDDIKKPFFKGKIALPTDAVGVNWVGTAILTKGEDWVKGLKNQEIHLVNATGAGIANMVATGQYAMTPVYHFTFFAADKKAGYPVELALIEPFWCTAWAWGLLSRSPTPYSAMLMIDYALSEEGQGIYTRFAYNSTIIGSQSVAEKYRTILPNQVQNYDQEYTKWEGVMREITTK
jgi:iron(III) transport system substrate-binding protein